MRKNIFLFISLGIAFICLIGWLSFSMVEKQIKLSVQDTLTSIINITEQSITDWAIDNRQAVNAIASSEQIISLTKELIEVDRIQHSLITSQVQKDLRKLLGPVVLSNSLRGFYIIAPDNISIASSRDENIGLISPLVDQPNFLQKIWDGETLITLPQPSYVPLMDSKGKLTHGYPTMFSAAPIRDEKNNIIAILTLRIDPFLEYIKILERGKIGESGETYAFNNQNLLISRSRFEKQLQEIGKISKDQLSTLNTTVVIPPLSLADNTSSYSTPISLLMMSNIIGSNFDGYLNYRLNNVVGIWKWNNKLGFGLSTEQDVDEAYIAIDSSRNFFIIFSLIMSIGFIIFMRKVEAERKKLETEIYNREQAEKEILKLAEAIEQSPVSIVMTDKIGNIEFVNKGFYLSTGFSKEEVIGKNPRILKSGLEPKEKYREMWQQLNRKKPWRGRLKNKTKDGSIITEDTVITPVLDQDGEISCYLGIKENISERLKLEEMLQHTQKMDAIGKLAGGIAHDFNNFLGIISGNIYLLQKTAELDEKNKERLDIVLKSIDKGVNLTKQLLSFTRKQAKIISTININETLTGLELLINQSAGQSASVVIKKANNLWLADIDPNELEDSIINLCINAGHAMQNGGILCIETSNIQLDVESSNDPSKYLEDFIQLKISDNGNGIPKHDLNNIFEPFFTTKSAEKGSGLGLSMVFAFMSRCKGEIKVESEESVGTTFKLYFPRSKTPVVDKKTIVCIEETLPTGTETILVVDDEKDLAEVAKSYLINFGYDVITAFSGEEALEILTDSSLNIKLVFSDVVMTGGINGFTLANEIIKTWPNVHVALTSGFMSNATEHLLRKDPVAVYLFSKLLDKPYTEKDLLFCVRETLDREILMEWNKELSVGIPLIDNDHLILISLLNQTYSCCQDNEEPEKIIEILEELANYTYYHFGREEEIMIVCNYPHIEEHFATHKRLLNQVTNYVNKAKQDLTPEIIIEILDFLHKWLVDHIIATDKGILKYAERNKIPVQKIIAELEQKEIQIIK